MLHNGPLFIFLSFRSVLRHKIKVLQLFVLSCKIKRINWIELAYKLLKQVLWFDHFWSSQIVHYRSKFSKLRSWSTSGTGTIIVGMSQAILFKNAELMKLNSPWKLNGEQCTVSFQIFAVFQVSIKLLKKIFRHWS